jgi:hypothetical protein
MSLPRVTLLYSNGNILQDVGAIDGVAAIIGTGTTAGLLNAPKTVFNLDDAIAQGFTLAAEPSMYRHLQEFYREVAGNRELKIMIVPNTVTLTQMLDNTNTTNGARRLTTEFLGRVRLLAVYRTPPGGYVGGANFIDSDVVSAIPNAKSFGDARLAELSPLRILIEGRVQNPSAANTLTPNASSNGYAGVVLGGTLTDGSASVGLALGRLCKYSAEVKIGKVANGPLSVSNIYIGSSLIKDVANLTTLHGAGFISFMTYPQKSGYFFGIDRMCSTDDYRLLVYGRVVDKAAVIAAAVFTEELENEIDIDDAGNIAPYEVTHIEQRIKQQIQVAMGAQISGEPSIYINPNQAIISTSKLTLKIRIRPKGYTSFIDVEMGITGTT